MQNRHYYKLPDDDRYQFVSCAVYAVAALFIATTLVFVLLKVAGVV